MRVRISVRLPEDVLEAVDRIAGPRGRSRYAEEAVRERIQRDERMQAIRAAAGIWKDHPLFPTDESVVEWVRAGRAERTSAGEPD
jgi:predicted transcriptional regulator